MGRKIADSFEGSGTIDQHPLPERIVAYHERRLPPDEAEEIRAHLAACPDCTTELLALADLYDDADDPAAEVSSAGLDAAWQRQRERLFPAAPVVPLESRREVRPPRRDWRIAAPFALAASLLAVVALFQWREIVRLEAPQINPPLVNLEPVDSTRRGGEAGPGVKIPAEAEWIWVILNPEDVDRNSRYDIEILAPDGKVVWQHKDLAVSESDNFRLPIHRSVLTTGAHRISLFDKRDGRRDLVEQFVLNVAAP